MFPTLRNPATGLAPFNSLAIWFERTSRAADFQALPTTPVALRAAIERQSDVTLVIK